MLAPELPRDIHDLSGIKGTVSIPGIRGGMSSLTVECVFHRNHPVLAHIPIVGREFTCHVNENAGVNILEKTVSHVKSFAAQ